CRGFREGAQDHRLSRHQGLFSKGGGGRSVSFHGGFYLGVSFSLRALAARLCSAQRDLAPADGEGPSCPFVIDCPSSGQSRDDSIEGLRRGLLTAADAGSICFQGSAFLRQAEEAQAYALIARSPENFVCRPPGG